MSVKHKIRTLAVDYRKNIKTTCIKCGKPATVTIFDKKDLAWTTNKYICTDCDEKQKTKKLAKKIALPNWLKNASSEIPPAEINRITIINRNNPKFAKSMYKFMQAHVKGKQLVQKGWEMMQKYPNGPKHEKGYQLYRNGMATLNTTTRSFKW
jgi:hypothetical protein